MKRKIVWMCLALVGFMAVSGAARSYNAYADDENEDIVPVEMTNSGLDINTTEDIEDIDSNKYDRGYLIVSPNFLRFQGKLKPGSTYTEKFKAYNIGTKPLAFNLSVEPYGVKDETYEQVYSEATNSTKVSEWVSFPGGTRFTLQPQSLENDDDEVEITVRVSVPSDAAAGGQYAAIMANIESTGISSTSSFQALARIALPLFSTIDGDLTYKGNLVNQGVTAFTFDPAIKASSTLENTGNADFMAKYHLKVTSFWDDTLVCEDPQEKVIMPETKRVLEQVCEENIPYLGIFNTAQEITYIDENGEQIMDTFKKITIICPLWLIVITIAIVVLIVVAVVFKVRSRKIQSKSKKKSSSSER